MVSGVNFKLGWRGSMEFLMRRMIIFMGRLVFCNTWVMRYVKGIYLPRYFYVSKHERRRKQNSAK